MIKLLVFLWCGCWHRWKLHEKVKVVRMEGPKEVYTADDYILQCERCGDFKRRRL